MLPPRLRRMHETPEDNADAVTPGELDFADRSAGREPVSGSSCATPAVGIRSLRRQSKSSPDLLHPSPGTLVLLLCGADRLRDGAQSIAVFEGELSFPGELFEFR